MYIHYKDSTFTVADSIMLKTLVEGCPVRDGMVVQQASALYSLIYRDFTFHFDDCVDNSFKNSENEMIVSDLNVEDSDFKIYPNPSTGDIFIKYTGKSENINAEICIFDVSGRVMYKNKINIFSVSKINTQLNNGTYFITIKPDNKAITNYYDKIIIIK